MNANDLSDLKTLSQALFPKHCQCCGRIYHTPQEFFEQTRPLQNHASGLKEDEGDDGQPIVDVFRNCVCGSTLMSEFQSRRDESPEGQRRRARYKR